MTYRDLQIKIAPLQGKLKKLTTEFNTQKQEISNDIQSFKDSYIRLNRQFDNGDKVNVTIRSGNGTVIIPLYVHSVKELTVEGDIIYSFVKVGVNGVRCNKVISSLDYLSIEKCTEVSNNGTGRLQRKR